MEIRTKYQGGSIDAFKKKIMLDTCNNQTSSHVKVPYRTNQIQRGVPRNRQDHPKRPQNTKWVIFKRDGSLDTPFSRLWQRLKLFQASHMHRQLMEQIRDSENFKETIIIVKSRQKKAQQLKRVIFKGDGSLDALFSWLWERLKLFWTPHMSR